MWKAIVSAHRTLRHKFETLTGSLSYANDGSHVSNTNCAANQNESENKLCRPVSSIQPRRLDFDSTFARVVSSHLKKPYILYQQRCGPSQNIHLLISSSQEVNSSTSYSGNDSKTSHNIFAESKSSSTSADTGSKYNFNDRKRWEDKDSSKNKATYNCFGCRHADNHSILEAFGWGAAVILGLHLCPYHREKYDASGQSVLSRSNALAMRRSILPNTSEISPSHSYTIPSPPPQSPPHTTSQSTTANQSTQTVLPDSNGQNNSPKVTWRDIYTEYSSCHNSLATRLAHLGHHSSAFQYFQEASNMGYSKASYNVALCYELGIGVEKNNTLAQKYYEKAAVDGNTKAMYNLAMIYMKQTNVEYSNKALELLEAAADKGLAPAQLYLGKYFINPESMHRDTDRGVRYFQKASQCRNKVAEHYLAICYEQGIGVVHNEAKAVELYTRSANAGHVDSLFNLAIYYQYGLGGLPIDVKYAKELYSSAAKSGHHLAKHHLKLLKCTEHEITAVSGSISNTLTSTKKSRNISLKKLLKGLFISNMTVDCGYEGMCDEDDTSDSSERERPRFYIGDDLNASTDISMQVELASLRPNMTHSAHSHSTSTTLIPTSTQHNPPTHLIVC